MEDVDLSDKLMKFINFMESHHDYGRNIVKYNQELLDSIDDLYLTGTISFEGSVRSKIILN